LQQTCNCPENAICNDDGSCDCLTGYTGSDCNSCASGYAMHNNECIDCDDGCDCENGRILQVYSGYWNNNGVCTACDSHSESSTYSGTTFFKCDKETGIVNKCEKGYYADGTQCKKLFLQKFEVLEKEYKNALSEYRNFYLSYPAGTKTFENGVDYSGPTIPVHASDKVSLAYCQTNSIKCQPVDDDISYVVSIHPSTEKLNTNNNVSVCWVGDTATYCGGDYCKIPVCTSTAAYSICLYNNLELPSHTYLKEAWDMWIDDNNNSYKNLLFCRNANSAKGNATCKPKKPGCLSNSDGRCYAAASWGASFVGTSNNFRHVYWNSNNAKSTQAGTYYMNARPVRCSYKDPDIIRK